MTPYNKEQYDAHQMVIKRLSTLPAAQLSELNRQIQVYLEFRRAVDAFLSRTFGEVCTARCYESERSACCTREGIITFFADAVINGLVSLTSSERLLAALSAPQKGGKCVYLGRGGCLWQLAPIVCKMFLCDAAQEEVFHQHPGAAAEWKALKERERTFRWPDRPVLFDALECFFLEAGYASPLMYLNQSPGLLRVKQRAGLHRVRIQE
jgi:hypothetical protein